MCCISADDPEPGNLPILSISNTSSRTNIPDNPGVNHDGEVSVTTERLPEMPDLEQEQVAVSIGGQEQEVVSIGHDEEEVLASPVEEGQLPLGVGQRNGVPDGTDEDINPHLIKPVQATD